MKRQRQVALTDLKVRAVKDDKGDETPVREIEGVAVVFSQPTTLLEQDGERTEEIIDPHAFDGIDLAKAGTVLDVNHNLDAIPLARVPGSLSLEVKEDGLHIKAALDTRQTGANDLLVALERGAIDKMSFAFTTAKDGYVYDADTKDGDVTVHHARVAKIERLYDVSAVTWPAYASTSLGLRSEMSQEEIDAIRVAKCDRLAAEMLTKLKEVE